MQIEELFGHKVFSQLLFVSHIKVGQRGLTCIPQNKVYSFETRHLDMKHTQTLLSLVFCSKSTSVKRTKTRRRHMTKIRNADLVITHIKVSGLFLQLCLVFCRLGDDEGEEEDAPYKLITNL